MTDDVLDQDLARELRAYAAGGVRPIVARVVAQTAITRDPGRRFVTPRSLAPGRAAAIATVALAAVVLVALLASFQRSSQSDVGGPPPTSSTTPQPGTTTRFQIATDAGIVHLTVPAGWRVADHEWAVYGGEGSYITTNGPTLAVQAPTSVVADVCPSGKHATFVPVGRTSKDFMNALEAMAGVERAGPIKMQVGGYPVKRLALTLPEDFEGRCGGPEGRILWQNASTSPFGLLNGGTAHVYVVDLDGVNLVIATHYRGVSRDLQVELARVVASIDIEAP